MLFCVEYLNDHSGETGAAAVEVAAITAAAGVTEAGAAVEEGVEATMMAEAEDTVEGRGTYVSVKSCCLMSIFALFHHIFIELY